jgi:hypothetical protein
MIETGKTGTSGEAMNMCIGLAGHSLSLSTLIGFMVSDKWR